MDLDVATLCWAKVPNLERLARALGVTPPVSLSPITYKRRLIRALLMKIEYDKRQAAAEERRAMDRSVAVETGGRA